MLAHHLAKEVEIKCLFELGLEPLRLNLIVAIDVVDEDVEDLGTLCVSAPDSTRDYWSAALGALFAGPVQLLQALLTELVKACSNGNGLFQNAEANAALEQVFKRPDRNELTISTLSAFLWEKARLLDSLIETQLRDGLHDNLVRSEPSEPNRFRCLGPVLNGILIGYLRNLEAPLCWRVLFLNVILSDVLFLDTRFLHFLLQDT